MSSMSSLHVEYLFLISVELDKPKVWVTVTNVQVLQQTLQEIFYKVIMMNQHKSCIEL